MFHPFLQSQNLATYEKWFTKTLEVISTLKVTNSLRNSAKAVLAISQFFIYEPLIPSEYALLINETDYFWTNPKFSAKLLKMFPRLQQVLDQILDNYCYTCVWSPETEI